MNLAGSVEYQAIWSALPGKRWVLIRDCRYAYVEFTEPAHVAQALVLNDSIFRGRELKVCNSPALSLQLSNEYHQVDPKRTNIPGMSRGRGRGRGRGGFGRGGFPPRGGYRGGYRGRARGYTPY
jgi:polyadenylate-binding protein 2